MGVPVPTSVKIELMRLASELTAALLQSKVIEPKPNLERPEACLIVFNTILDGLKLSMEHFQ